MKKILIFGLARTGTTLLQQQFSKALSLKSYNEPFNTYEHQKQIGNPYHWILEVDQGIIKVLAQNLDYVNLLEFINVGKFDSVVVTRRKNLTDACISLYYAEQITKKYHYDIKPDVIAIKTFTVPTTFINNFFLNSYRWYVKTMQQLDDQSIPYTIFDYDQYQAGGLQTINGIDFCQNKNMYDINTVSSDIDYSKICINYKEITLAIENENNH